MVALRDGWAVIANAVEWAYAAVPNPADLTEMDVAAREGKVGWFGPPEAAPQP